MNNSDAQKLLNDRLAKLRALSYSELVARMDSVLTEELARDSERTWQLEFEVQWADEPEGNVRVSGLLDDGGLRDFVPLTASFIKTPAGELVED